MAAIASIAAAKTDNSGSMHDHMAVAPAFIADTGRSIVLELSREQIAASAAAAPGIADSVRIAGVPLDLDRTVTLDLVRFHAVTPGARFEVMTERGAESLAFDPDSVILLRGRVEGYRDSHVFLALGSRVTNGWIDLGPDGAHGGRRSKFWVREAGGEGDGGEGAGSHIAGSIAVEVFPAMSTASGGPGLAVPMCGTITGPADRSASPGQNRRTEWRPDPAASADLGPILGLKQIELAVDTDDEYYMLFNDPVAAGEYLVSVYGAMSDMYIREVRASIVISYFRIWTVPDPFTGPNPIGQFAQLWIGTQQGVHRDLAQLWMGRTDLDVGGVAYLHVGCDSFSSYSMAGYVLGHFGDLDRNDDYSRDIRIAAHEVGHNVGALHNDAYGLDNCGIATPVPSRGGIMSYCAQTVSGASGNIDGRLEARIRRDVRAHIESRACLANDCNLNGVSDAIDIQLGTSPDANSDSIPDECQDCNANLILDPVEIALGLVPDVNANGLPDSCDPDCNGNGVPDDRDIFLGTSADAYQNGVPDECEADCNANNISDYTEIRLDMPLDVDRDVVLDSCQDCDGDGIIDRYELAHAHHLWAGAMSGDVVLREFHSASGVRTQSSQAATGAGSCGDVLITPEGRVFATSMSGSRIIEYGADGSIIGELAGPGEGLSRPTFMTLDPRGDLLVSNSQTHSVLKFDLPSGTPMGAFVQPSAGGLTTPHGLAYGPDGHLYVASSNTGPIRKFDGATGAPLGDFTVAGAGGLAAPRGICWLPSGNLLVASMNTFNIIQYNGATGASMGQWQTAGSGSALLLEQPWDVVIGPGGHVFASASGMAESAAGPTAPLHVTTARVFQYRADNGWFIRALVVGHDSGLMEPTGLAFYPDFGTDCNLNALPDDCDISSGRSFDANRNGVPDECECVPDLTAGAIPGQAGYGAPNGVVNNDDFFYYTAQFAAGNLAVADLTTTAIPGSVGYGVPNGVISNDDFFYYLMVFSAGC